MLAYGLRYADRLLWDAADHVLQLHLMCNTAIIHSVLYEIQPPIFFQNIAITIYRKNVRTVMIVPNRARGDGDEGQLGPCAGLLSRSPNRQAGGVSSFA